MTKRKMWLDFFPYGTQYYRFPTPRPEEWEKDLRKLAAIGYTHVQFRPQWRSHERIRGHYEWDDIDRLFELAERNRLRVVLKPLLECAPDWIFRDCGGTRIGFGGMPLPPIAHGAFYVGGWLPCFDHPEVMAAGAAFARAAAERYKGHAALWFYDAWNEPRSRPAGQCHCVHSVASYRHWLADRFGSIEALNQAFGKAWTGFDYVMPPESANDYAEMFLWRQWAAWAVAEQVRQVGEAIHRADPDRAEALAKELCQLNRERQSVEQDICADAIDQIGRLPASERSALVLASERWHQGVVGIVASRLSEKYSCPSFMIHLKGGMGKGSCRSWGGFNLFAALESCSDLLEEFGGHELAAGFTIREENIPAFRSRMNRCAHAAMDGNLPVPSLDVDCAITSPAEVTLPAVEEQGMLEP